MYTNKMGCGSFRGPGGIQAILPNRRLTSSAANWAWTLSPFGVAMAYKKVGPGAGVRLRRVGMREGWIVRLTLCIGTSRPQPGKKVGRGVACGEWRLGGGRAREPG